MRFLRLLAQAVHIWFAREADVHAAALAYFVPFALTPLFLLSITIVGMLIGGNEVALLLLSWGNLIDPELTVLLDSSVRNFDTLTTAYVVPIIALLFFSTMIIVSLNSVSSALHKIWDNKVTGFYQLLQRTARSCLFVVLLQVYLVWIIMLNRTVIFIAELPLIHILDKLYPLIVFSSTVLLITLGYGLLPVAAPSFKARFYGAFVSSALFFCTRGFITFHNASSPIPSVFGAAGLIILLLMWIYVSASIVLYGAAFAAAYEADRLKRATT